MAMIGSTMIRAYQYAAWYEKKYLEIIWCVLMKVEYRNI
ncbi:hypothetical protein MIDIC_450005 [Alphaproteobacteria bacterium]